MNVNQPGKPRGQKDKIKTGGQPGSKGTGPKGVARGVSAGKGAKAKIKPQGKKGEAKERIVKGAIATPSASTTEKAAIQTSVSAPTIPVAIPSEAELLKELDKVLSQLQERHSLDADVVAQFRAEISIFPRERLESFIEKTKTHIIKKAGEAQGWGDWLWSAPTRLKDRAVEFYRQGEANLRELKTVFGSAAGNMIWQGREVLDYTPLPKVAETVLYGVNTSMSIIGNKALGAAAFTLPTTAEWLYKGFAFLTGDYSDENREEIAKEAKEINKYLKDHLGPLKISEKPVQNFTNQVTGTLGAWATEGFWKRINEFSPTALLEQCGAEVLVPLVQGKRIDALMKIAVSSVLTQVMMESYGPRTLKGPDYMGTVVVPGALTPLQIGVAVYCIVTAIQTATVPVQEAGVKLLTKGGPASMRALGIKKAVKLLEKELVSLIPGVGKIIIPLIINTGKKKIKPIIKGVTTVGVGILTEGTKVILEEVLGKSEEPVTKPVTSTEPGTAERVTQQPRQRPQKGKNRRK